MKYITYALASCSIVVLIVFVLLTIDTKAAREVELKDALPTAVESAMEATAMKGSYAYADRNAFIADFTALLLEQINASEKGDPNLNVKVDIAGADEKKHLISVHVEALYTQPDGKKGRCEVERTAILETEHQRKVYTVSYYYYNPELYTADEKKSWTNSDGSIRLEPVYCSYDVVEGETIPVPSLPSDVYYKGKQTELSGWIDMESNTTLEEGTKAGGNRTFVAH